MWSVLGVPDLLDVGWATGTNPWVTDPLFGGLAGCTFLSSLSGLLTGFLPSPLLSGGRGRLAPAPVALEMPCTNSAGREKDAMAASNLVSKKAH